MEGNNNKAFYLILRVYKGRYDLTKNASLTNFPVITYGLTAIYPPQTVSTESQGMSQTTQYPSTSTVSVKPKSSRG